MADLTGKVAILSGGGRGMGVAHARALATAGARIVFTDIADGEGPALAAEIGSERARFVRHDVRDASDWARVVDLAEATFGRIDILVNNAAIFAGVSIMDCTPEQYREIIEVNQVGCFLGMRAVVPAMRRVGGGSIINISSTGGFVGSANAIGYCDAKFALRGMSKVAAIEFGRDKIRVNTVHPGAIATPLLLTHPDFARYEREALVTPLARIGRPEEISHMVVFLASDEASFSTGAEFIADGGQLVQ